MGADDIVFPGWYSDPTQPGYQRWWDGRVWTERVRIEPPGERHRAHYVEDDVRPTIGAGPNSRILIGAAGIGHVSAIVGSLLPWATVTSVFGTMNLSGTSGDGLIVFVLGLLGLISSAFAFIAGSRGAAVVSALVAVVILSVGGYDMMNVSEVAGDELELAVVQVGIGLWIVLAGGIVALIAALASVFTSS